MKRLALAACAAAVLAFPPAAHAAQVNVTFTGTILAGAFDTAGTVYGQGPSGQVGDTITGSFLIDTAGIIDTTPNPNIGTWVPPTNPFPQPFSFLSGSYTIDGVTVQVAQHLVQPNSHSVEEGMVYNQNSILTPGGQEYLRLVDSSQLLLCSDVNVPATCTGGEIARTQLILNIFSYTDWLTNETLEQSFSLDEATINAMVAGGGAATGEYYHLRRNEARTAFIYDSAGQFNLTSLSFAPVANQPVGTPEPASLAILGIALAGLIGARRR